MNKLLLPLVLFAKVIVPFIFVIGSIVSLSNSFKRKRLYSSVAKRVPVKKNDCYSDSQYDPIENMSWQNFEMLVSVFFKEQGYTVKDYGGAGADGGIDLMLKKNGKKIIVQCKHWKTYKVGVNIVREQFGIMTAEGVDEVIIVTSGNFTHDAEEFAKNKSITLLSGDKLKEIISKGIEFKLESANYIDSTPPPNCPHCSAVMVVRTAQKGKWAGKNFWGCPQFPRCKGLVQK